MDGHGESPESAAVADLKSLDSRRLAARLIDELLIIGGFVLLRPMIGVVGWAAALFLLWAMVVYFFLCEAIAGQTVGKAVLGLRVVSRDGSPARANGVAVRNVVRIFEEPFLALIVMASSRKRRQRIGDLFGGTTVGRATGSKSPAPSWLRYAYPALWIAGAILLAITLDPPVQATADGVNRRALDSDSLAFLQGVESMCQEHDRFFDNAGKVPMNLIVQREMALTGDIADLDVPTSMIPVRDRLVDARQGLVNKLTWVMRRIAGRSNPQRVYNRLFPQVLRERRRAYETFRDFAIECDG